MGAFIPHGTLRNVDLNEVFESGAYIISLNESTNQNMPVERNGVLLVFKSRLNENIYTPQIYVDTDSKLFYRLYTSYWSAWKEL